MEETLGFEEKWSHCIASIQAFNQSFKNPKKKRKEKRRVAFILTALAAIEGVWFAAIASGWFAAKVSTKNLLIPVLFYFLVAVFLTLSMDENTKKKEMLRSMWVRNKIMPILYPQFRYQYEDNADIKESILAFYKEYVDTGASELHYYGCLMNDLIDMYEVSIYGKEQEPSFFGICIVLPNDRIKNRCALDHTMEAMEKDYYAIKNIEEGFLVVYKESTFWIFCTGISFDQFMDGKTYNHPAVPKLGPIEKESVCENQRFINQIYNKIIEGKESDALAILP